MARILCITSGLAGILNASYELMHRLQLDGHDIISASPKSVGQQVAAQGFAYVQLQKTNFDPAPPIPAFHSPFRKLKRWIHKANNYRYRREKGVEALGMRDFENKLKQINPDLVILDIELHEHIITLITHNYRVLLLSQWFCIWNRKGLPPIQSITIPGIGLRGTQLGIRMHWWWIEIQRWWIFSKKKLTSFYTDRRSILQFYARISGFPKKFIRDNYWPGPFTYSYLPVMSLTAKELDFPHTPRPEHHYVGPMIYENRKSQEKDILIEEYVEEIIEEKNNSGKKLIYCTVSTFQQGDVNFIKKVIHAVATRPDWILIVALGGLIDPATFPDSPEDIHLISWAPQLAVLKEADCSINHGGIHTINECIHYHVPMLIYSGKRSDQNGCAARIKYHRIGLIGDKDRDNSEDILHKINSLISEPEYLKNMETIASNCQAYRHERVLENIVKKYCQI